MLASSTGCTKLMSHLYLKQLSDASCRQTLTDRKPKHRHCSRLNKKSLGKPELNLIWVPNQHFNHKAVSTSMLTACAVAAEWDRAQTASLRALLGNQTSPLTKVQSKFTLLLLKRKPLSAALHKQGTVLAQNWQENKNSSLHSGGFSLWV